MHRVRWLGALVICVVAAGCHIRPDGPLSGGTSAVRARSLGPVAPTDGLYVESILIERPLGDPFLDRDLWNAGLPAVDPEPRALLAENGLRVVILGGNLPPRFQTLLGSELDTVSPRGLTFGARKDAVIPTAGPTDRCEYEVLRDLAGQRTKVSLRQANGGILIRPEQLADGRVRLRCEPQVQHGARQDWIRPNADGTGFTMQGEVPLEAYPKLGFDAVLSPGEYLVIGWPARDVNRLGAALFAVEARSQPRQRVLVLRAGRVGDTGTADLPAIPNPRGRPSIAAEASRR